jgi:hypothetical protein
MTYSGVYVFGDSLVDSGNALKLAQWYGDLTFSDLPEGAPTSELGYYKGRFSNGYNFADLVSNKEIGAVTQPVFPYGFEDPWIGIPIAPFAGDPSGNNLNFAYGGAQIRQGGEAVPDFDGQTDAFKDAVDGHADPNALYLITIGGNDVRSLAPSGSDPDSQADGYAALDKAAEKYLTEASQLVAIGARHILITGVPDVGLIPKYDRDGNLVLDATEQQRADAASDFSVYLDTLLRTEVVPALQALGATVTYVPLMDYVDASGHLVTGALSANLGTIAALHGLTVEELSGNLLQYQDLLFFDQIHPNAQANALLGAYMHAQLTGTPWIETLPLTSAEVDYRLTASIAAPGEVDKLVVALVAGTTYTLDMLGVSSLGTAGSLADPSLRLLGPSGALFGSNADSGAGFDATMTFTAATTGNYTIEMSSTGNPTGNYVLQAAVIGGAAALAGNTYTVSNASAVVLEGAGGIGQDVVKASVNYALSQGGEIEVLRTTNDKGKTAINLTGNEFGQEIIGNAGANVLEGKAGADTFTGLGGKDVFVLSKSAVDNPGAANIDRITDYASGDVVDVTQILKVAAGTNVLSGGYLRVTTGGLVQVDLNGGANEWVTLSTINGTGTVAVRYGSGGAVTSVSVGRTADGIVRSMSAANSNSVLVGAIAAAGLMSAPAAAHDSIVADHGATLVASQPIDVRGLSAPTATEGLVRSALAGEIREAVAESAERPSPNVVSDAAGHLSNALVVQDAAPAVAVTELLRGTDIPVQAHASLVADAVVMPAADLAAARAVGAAGEANANGGVARVLAEALSGGGDNAIDALLDALPGNAHAAVAQAMGADAGHMAAFVSAHAAFGVELLAIHVDAPPLA